MTGHGRSWSALLICVLAAQVLVGCSTRPTWVRPQASLELEATPFHPQTLHHCGPAALATVLGADGIEVGPDQLAPLVYVPGREGSLQAEMIAAARRFERLPYPIAPRPEALIESLAAGYPVLVLQNLGLRSWPHWHYAVVVGYDSARGEFLLRSGTTRRLAIGERRFLRSWALAQSWGVVMARPERTPPFAEPDRWIRAAAAFESLGRPAAASTAYLAATQRWPDSVLSWQALANARHAQGENAAAESALRRALALDPGSAASANNYASLLLARGCTQTAQAVIDRVGSVPAPYEVPLRQTRESIAAALAEARPEPADCAR